MMDITDRQLIRTFHRSMMLTAGLAGVILCSAEGTLFPSALTPIIAVVAWIFVDRQQKFHLPILFANVLGLWALFAAAWEFVSGDIESKLLSGAHLIVYLNWIVLLLKKSVRQYWWILALSLLQLAVAAVLTSSAGFGVSLIGMLLVLLWTLSVFSFYRVRLSRPDAFPERQEASSPRSMSSVRKSIEVSNGLQRDPNEPWINLRFRGVVLLSFAASLMLSMIVFAAFPRVWVPTSPFPATAEEGRRRTSIAHRTGFTEHVSLGEIGSILQNSGRVLQFTINNIHSGEVVSAENFAADMNMGEVRFRGNAMGSYRDGSWSRGLSERGFPMGEMETDRFGDVIRLEPVYRLEITQDPPVSQFAFAVFPICSAKAKPNSGRIMQRHATGSLVWHVGNELSPQAPRSFVVECPSVRDDPAATFEHWTIIREVTSMLRARLDHQRLEVARRIFLTENLEGLVPRLYEFSQKVCHSDGGPLTPQQQIARIMSALSAQNGFRYSLNLTRVDRELDPVEDFLLNSKSGHCEYFASACTLMLQSVGIPARLVNGFSGSEVNAVTGKNEVKQHHAHAWVEAFVDGRWETLDPTPEADRQTTISEVKSGTLLTDLRAAISDLWSGGIHNLTLERQRAFFDPVLKLGTSVSDSVKQQGLMATVRLFFTRWLTSPESWFSWQGGVMTFALLSLMALLIRMHPLRRLRQLWTRVFERFGSGTATTQSVIRFYAKFCELCEAHGLPIQASATAIENAQQAAAFFAERLADDDLRQLPLRIACAFNDVRFGKRPLSDEQMQSVSRDLETWTAALQNQYGLKPNAAVE